MADPSAQIYLAVEPPSLVQVYQSPMNPRPIVQVTGPALPRGAGLFGQVIAINRWGITDPSALSWNSTVSVRGREYPGIQPAEGDLHTWFFVFNPRFEKTGLYTLKFKISSGIVIAGRPHFPLGETVSRPIYVQAGEVPLPTIPYHEKLLIDQLREQRAF
ncbi:hypothetical protein B0T19DRAFT_472550 [Cercophora scortea]|uniref:Uncharacterized protein n=1 Tax=Cercophora scortea TaxID=314031 RepID=A0AAE0J700_9PEZI|nr:hypothetical protein B0T19DRAFT_472550 [Cercophora scortea]